MLDVLRPLLQHWILVRAIQILFFLCIKRDNSQKKCTLFGIDQFIKHLQKGAKLNVIIPGKSTQKDMVTDEIGVPNDVIHV